MTTKEIKEQLWQRWITGKTPNDMFNALASVRYVRDRPVRYAACAFVRRILHVFPEAYQQRVLEHLALIEYKTFIQRFSAITYNDIQRTIEQEAAAWVELQPYNRFTVPKNHMQAAFRALVWAANSNIPPCIHLVAWLSSLAPLSGVFTPSPDFTNTQHQNEQAVQADILRDVHGYFLDPVDIYKYPNSSLIDAMATSIHDEFRFSELPILADVLEDTGPTPKRVLEHLRENTIHVRGCWVLHALLTRARGMTLKQPAWESTWEEKR